jgi:hypothetical protein
MITLDTMADQFHNAETTDDRTVCMEHLRMAAELLADGVINNAGFSRKRLEGFALRAGENANKISARSQRDPANETAGDRVLIIRWGNLMTTIAEYLESGGVPMPDGRVATADGWNYENCEPFHLVLDEDTNARLIAQARKLLPNADQQACNSLLDKILRQWLKDAR